ncbi:MAG TPA: hypothetical protein VFT99_07675, partial [Roseiflexaceae bacterium]|nr:hypothetical protein [Roseiflexaceae bacterium]
FYSWNGATEVVSYRVYAGRTVDTLKAVETRPRTGFETNSALARSDCYFKVEALDKHNNVLGTSNVVQDTTLACLAEPEPPTQWFVYQPYIVRP